MRYTIRTLPGGIRRYGLTEVAAWWDDLPWRRRPLRRLAVLLFAPGRGWLRWGLDEYVYVEPIPGFHGRGPRHVATCAPPLRRLWSAIRYRNRLSDVNRWLTDPDWPDAYMP